MIHVFYVAALVFGVLLFLALRAFIHLVLLHWEMIALCAGLGLPVLALIVRAMGKGMLHHTRISWNVLPPAAPARQLPAPVRGFVLPRQQEISPFSTEMIAEPEETPCEGPGCGEMTGEMPWTVDAVTEEDGQDPVTETHSFCSRDCAENYARQHQDLQATGA